MIRPFGDHLRLRDSESQRNEGDFGRIYATAGNIIGLRRLQRLTKADIFTQPNRREFLGTLGAFSPFPLEQEKPDLILYNGNIHTVNANAPQAQAIAVSRGRIIGIGSDSDAMNLASAGSRKTDLGKKTVLAGFIDAHSHPAIAGVMRLRMVDCDLRSIAAIQAALRERAAKTPAGEWMLGLKYDDTKTSDDRPLTISDLDAVVPDHPVQIEHRGGHTIYCNSVAFERAGINDKTPDPAGGKIDHDPATGKLSGRAAESARALFDRQSNSEHTDARRSARRRQADFEDAGEDGDYFRSRGAGHADGVARLPGCARGGRTALSRVLLHQLPVYRFNDCGRSADGIRQCMVRVGAMKLVCDGSISERTARLSQPYEGKPNDYGILVMTAEELYEYGRKAHLAGWQPADAGRMKRKTIV